MSLTNSLRSMFGNALLVKHEEGPEIYLQIGRTVTKAPKYMRTQLWLGVLQRHPGLGNAAAKHYPLLLRKDVHPTTADDIAKDVGRTFPNMPRFTSEAGKARLQRVLMAYAAYDPEVNYCQGMNFVAAVLLIWLPREADAFGGMVVLMKERGLRELYKSDMKALQARLWQISKILPGDLAGHLEQHAVLPVLYASSWLLTAFSADFPLFWSSRVLDVIFTDCYIEPMMKVVLGIITTCKPVLMQSNDMEAMVHYIKANVPRWRHALLQEVLTDSLSMEWTPAQQILLKQMEAEESVIQAVHRVNDQIPDVVNPERPRLEATRMRGSGRLNSMSWANRIATPVDLSPQASKQHLAVDLMSEECKTRSNNDALDHSTSSDAQILTAVGHQEQNTNVSDPPIPLSRFRDHSHSFHSQISQEGNRLPTCIEVQFSKHSSTGSFGEFAGPSVLDDTQNRIAQEHASLAERMPSNDQLKFATTEGSRSIQDPHMSDHEKERKQFHGQRNLQADENWWQGQDRGNTLEKSRNSILDDRSRDIPSDSMYSLGSRHQQSDQGKNDPFANLQSLDMFSSYHSSQEFPSMQRQSGSLLDGSGAIESLSSRKHNPPTTDHDLEHKLEEELLNFSISSRTEDSRKLPMNLNRAGRM